MRTLFRCDADPWLGGGHVMRCLALAGAVVEVGFAPVFAVRPGTLETVPQLAKSGFPVIVLNCDDEVGELAGYGSAEVLVIDHYRRDETFEQACRRFASIVVVVDDLASRPHDCDLLIDQNAGRRAEDYSALVPPSALVRVGPAYALLRPGFAAARAAGVARRPGPLRRVFVGLGLMDPHGIVPRIAVEVAAVDAVERVDVVMGGQATSRAALEAVAAASGGRIQVHFDLADPAPLLVEADCAIGAGGVSAWERCCLGVPSLTIELIDNQRPGLDALSRVNAATPLGAVIGLAEGAITTALARLAADPARRAAMAASAARLCDGLGARRVAGTLLALTAGGAPVTLRPIVADDVDLLFDWQCRPETRRHFRNPQPPSRTEHNAWFAARLADSGCLFTMVMAGDHPVGMLRLDADGPDRYEVSILVAAEFQGAGIGRRALDQARLLVPGATLVAEVAPANSASRRMFAAAGYQPADERLWVLQ